MAAATPVEITPRPYQLIARDFIRGRKASLVADAMRLGKTLEALLAHDPAEGKLVIVAPLATRDVWLSWTRKLWPHLQTAAMVGAQLDVEALKAPIVFLHYDIVRYWRTLGVLDIATLVLDEAHLLTNESSQRWQSIVCLVSSAKRIVALTGTPVWNKPAGIYGMLNLLTPGAWGSFKAFSHRYASGHPGAHGWITGNPTHEDEFCKRLETLMLRRTWDDVLPEMPTITRAVDVVPITAAQGVELDRHAAAVRSNSPGSSSTIGEIARMRYLIAQTKTVRAAELAAELPDEPVVIWTWHRVIAEEIARRVRRSHTGMRECFSMTGDAGATLRGKILGDWQRSPKGVLVATISVGQVGIDLSHARHAIFAEEDWTPATVAQAEMRTFAPSRPMSITYLVADHWLDRRIVKALIEKCRNAAKLGLPAAESAIDVIGQALDLDVQEDWNFFDLFSSEDLAL